MSAKIQTFLKQLETGHIDTMRAKIYNEIKQCQSISTKTLRERFGSHQSVTSSLSSLESDGLIRKCGKIEIDDAVYSQWVAHTNFEAIMIFQSEMQLKKKLQWIKRAQKMGWIDNQVAYFLKNHIFKNINFYDENTN
jgi:hypothetical protein